jgi:hypothetical protein
VPNPTQSDLHVNVPLTNVSVAYMQSASSYIADKVFPPVPVNKQSDLYWRYSKSDWRRTDVKRRAPGTETAGVGWNMNTGNYFCHVYGVHKDIADQERANSDSEFNLDRDATEFITNQHLLQRDVAWSQAYFQTGVWSTQFTGVDTAPTSGQFMAWDQASSDPVGDVARMFILFRQLTGFAPNVGVLGAYVMAALKQHPDIIDRIKYTQRGIVTEDLIATLFDIDELYVNYSTQSVGPQMPDAVEQDAAATFNFIGNPTAVLFAYAPSAPSLLTPSAGYTFTWRGYLGGNAKGIRVKRFRMENLASDRIEAEQTYDMQVVCPDMGMFLSGACSVPVV